LQASNLTQIKQAGGIALIIDETNIDDLYDYMGGRGGSA
jgi:hypothetical protein